MGNVTGARSSLVSSEFHLVGSTGGTPGIHEATQQQKEYLSKAFDMQNTEVNQTGSNPLDFIRDVAKYFMDFLESDFHKRKNPKRSIRLRDTDNLLVGVNLGKYPSFGKLVWKEIKEGFQGHAIQKLSKGAYRSRIPENLIALVDLRIQKIDESQVAYSIDRIAEKIRDAAEEHKTDYDQALTVSLEASAGVVKQELVLPFVKHLEKPIENQGLGDENIVYLMEEELTSVLVRLIENKISELLNYLLAESKPNLTEELASVFSLREIQPRISSFFQNLRVGDLYAEAFEMERNRRILDKQEFYLYFCDIQFDKAKYPIFYIPFAVEREDGVLRIEFDYQVYVNKKALEYVVQEYNRLKDVKGRLLSVTERIIYLAQHDDDFEKLINTILSEVSSHFNLDRIIDISDPQPQRCRSLLVQVTNACYISLFDKSDEALVNDYEDILQLLSEDGSALAEIFNTLIDDFIHKNPKSFNREVDDEWDDTYTPEKLVFNSPIPLNGEQLQIISAVRKEGCKYITVEGPPGTGKSHTITAIVFDAILKHQSVLVLSDKKEALDVVEDKITSTLRSVRTDDRFQNPILRLGKIGSNYSQILSTTAIGDIKNHYRVVRKGYDEIESNISKIGNTLRDDLEAEMAAYHGINLAEVRELIQLERVFEKSGWPFDIKELIRNREPATTLEELRGALLNARDKLVNAEVNTGPRTLFDALEISPRSLKTLGGLWQALNSLSNISDIIATLRDECGDKLSSISIMNGLNSKDLRVLGKYLEDLRALRHWFFAYTFRKRKLKALDHDLNHRLPDLAVTVPHEHTQEIQQLVSLFEKAAFLNADKYWPEQLDYSTAIFRFLTNAELLEILGSIDGLNDDLYYIYQLSEKLPETFLALGLDVGSLQSVFDNTLTNLDNTAFEKLVRYLDIRGRILRAFDGIPAYSYTSAMKELESLVTAQMTYLLDGRLIEFYENNRATAKALREIIRKKQRFPKDEFGRLKEAFPCILAGIRDYAEFIPLEPEIFDLVIIDEASQVSIAQAFPALLRARKVLILGDRKQFSNVKAAQARTTTNREYLNELERSFKKNVSQDPTKLVKLAKFNIKTSILEFFEFIYNYNSLLKKHFRGYKEIISYSNEYFYQNNLQVMKIRGKPIQDVLRFEMIRHDGKREPIPNTNSLEVQFIIDELLNMKVSGRQCSVGIITPHTNQQKLFIDKVNELPDRNDLFDRFNLKIMTFDTCQGEERDVIFYSMVANAESDRLWGIFIKDLDSVDVEEEGKIKAQRLNVGFSRAREQVVFVLSKPIQDFAGSIRQALLHYQYTLQEARKECEVSEVDSNSPMESEVMNWFYQTRFWRQEKDRISFIPQFEIGKYLKQLDPQYRDPEYRVDFLLVFTDGDGKTHNIIIEYDGFREHFGNADAVTEYNYESYYSEEDVYREKVLESYGYKFLRINRFNVGDNPIQTLNQRILKLVKEVPHQNSVVSQIQETVVGLQSGDKKECPKCNEVRAIEDFKDASLLTGVGRICNHCKGIIGTQAGQNGVARGLAGSRKLRICPKCGSEMVLRSGRHGRFYGCSRFPYCKGTSSN